MTSCNKLPDSVVQNDLARWNLKGSVKTVSEIHYIESGKYLTTVAFNEDGFVAEQASYNPDKSLIRKWVFDYDINNRKDSLHCYILNDSLSYTLKYSYDHYGNVISIVNVRGDSLGTVTTVSYDAENHKVKEDVNDEAGNTIKETIFKYKNGLPTEEAHDDAIMHRTWKQLTSYTSRNEKEMVLILSDQNSLVSKTTYRYDDKGKIVEINSFASENVLEYKVTSTYNENGDEEDRIKFLPNGSVEDHQTFEYRYDTNENWIFRSTKAKDQMQDYVTRDIAYYY